MSSRTLPAPASSSGQTWAIISLVVLAAMLAVTGAFLLLIPPSIETPRFASRLVTLFPDVFLWNGSAFQPVPPSASAALDAGARLSTSERGEGRAEFPCGWFHIFRRTELRVEQITLNAAGLTSSGAQLFKDTCELRQLVITNGTPPEAVVKNLGSTFVTAHDPARHITLLWVIHDMAELTNLRPDGTPGVTAIVHADMFSIVRNGSEPEPVRSVAEMGAVLDELELWDVYARVLEILRDEQFQRIAATPAPTPTQTAGAIIPPFVTPTPSVTPVIPSVTPIIVVPPPTVPTITPSPTPPPIARCTTAALAGTAFNDLNRDGQWNPFIEPRLAGVMVQLNSATNTFTATAITDAYGNYRFWNVPLGQYRISANPPPGLAATTVVTRAVNLFGCSEIGGFHFGFTVPISPTPTPTNTPITREPESSFLVINVSASAAPAWGDTCPQTFTFNGTIAVTGINAASPPPIITYRWLRSDGAQGPLQTLMFLTAGTQYVTPETWTLGEPGSYYYYEGSARLEVLSPVNVTSQPASFRILCDVTITPTYTPTYTPTFTPTPSATPCPEIGIALDPSQFQDGVLPVHVGVRGGCEPYTGMVNVFENGEPIGSAEFGGGQSPVYVQLKQVNCKKYPDGMVPLIVQATVRDSAGQTDDDSQDTYQPLCPVQQKEPSPTSTITLMILEPTPTPIEIPIE